MDTLKLKQFFPNHDGVIPMMMRRIILENVVLGAIVPGVDTECLGNDKA
ncbi:MAG TPA: hypothetical protein VGL56_08640 [Fimbriimonadaceae bacterium]|jgi:hypothetical protein